MPFKSKAQLRKFYAMEAAGEIPKGTTEKWKKHTESMSALPEKKEESKEASEMVISELTQLKDKLAEYLYVARTIDAARSKEAAEAIYKQSSMIKTVEPVDKVVSKEDIPEAFKFLKKSSEELRPAKTEKKTKIALQTLINSAISRYQPMSKQSPVVPGKVLQPMMRKDVKMTGPTSKTLNAPDIINTQGPIGTGDITNSAKGVSANFN